MGAVLPAKLREMSRASDPGEGIRKALGAVLNEIKIRGQQVLVATYIEPDKTAGGIWKPDITIQESLWMGTTGLVVKKGPWAFLPEKWPDHDPVEIGETGGNGWGPLPEPGNQALDSASQ